MALIVSVFSNTVTGEMLGHTPPLANIVNSFKNKGSTVSVSTTSDYFSVHHQKSSHSLYPKDRKLEFKCKLLPSVSIHDIAENFMENKKDFESNHNVRQFLFLMLFVFPLRNILLFSFWEVNSNLRRIKMLSLHP